MPTLMPAGGDYPTTQVVTVTSGTAGATLHYTTTGLEPTTSDATVASGSTITVDRAMRVRVKAFKDGLQPSRAVTADYWITGTVAAGDKHTVVLKADGTVWTWGANNQGQLGNNTTTDQWTPVQAQGLTDVVAIAAGTLHTLAARRDGTVWAWGANSSGMLGEPPSTQRRTVPTQVAGLTDVIQVAAGTFHSVARKRDGTICLWGNNTSGQLGDGSGVLSRSSPVCLALAGIADIAAGGNHTVALKTDGDATGSVWTWGENQWGQIGDGTTTERAIPIRVLDDARAIGAGLEHTLAIVGDRSATGWGRNMEAALGDGTQINRVRPSALADLDDVADVTGGGKFSLVLTRKASIWTSGAAPLASTFVVPYRMAPLGTSVIAAAAGGGHGVAARRDGLVWTWGANGDGQLGDGTWTGNQMPKPVPGFSLVDGSWLTADPDADGLPTWRELNLGSDPRNADTNDDGLRDGAAVQSGHSATDPDMDDDGVANAVEQQRGTDPMRVDTDGDGVSDATDAYPLDAARSQPLAPVPGDTTPPVILLTFPSNAVRILP